ncbi:MAG: type II secretion system protein N [Candidatus Omnitrophota bacterium]
MTHKDEISPEEKLLNLIRRSDKKSSKQKSLEHKVVLKSDAHPKTSASSVINNQSIPRDKRGFFTGIKFFNFVLINRSILLAVFILSALLFIDSFLRYPNFSKFSIPIKNNLKIAATKDKAKPYEYYSQEISKRTLFNIKSPEFRAERVIPAGQTFKELIRELQLLGVVFGDNLQVIIEDKRLQKTYFLYPGDYLGEIKVEEVYPDRVILEFNGERVSLFL